MQNINEALTFDDVLILPALSDFKPDEASLETLCGAICTRKLELSNQKPQEKAYCIHEQLAASDEINSFMGSACLCKQY